MRQPKCGVVWWQQELIYEAGAIVSPGLPDLDHPLLSVHIQRDLSVGVVQAYVDDYTGNLKLLVCGPAPFMMCTMAMGPENAKCAGKERQPNGDVQNRCSWRVSHPNSSASTDCRPG
ncbi:hypothetical protein GCM10011352_23130 [Marinobacterium zhoushanense]|uniref:Uncharacterized protein n=1 Tax=Marinobacterium zhoushanense TaxID=1679163 RepID=A0ABQ1KHZ4_9GAMM|nr:hypothetical protein GCM10011352_23130 [Marinobacterium zhoushanense]